MADITSRGTITVATESCKGCDLCIPACPPKVLSMSEDVNAMGFRRAVPAAERVRWSVPTSALRFSSMKPP